MTTREELFKKAKEKHEQNKKEEELKKSTGGSKTSFNPIQWGGFSKEIPEYVFRIIGLPHELRQKGTDGKFIYFSKCVNDKGTHSHIVWKQDETGNLDDSWIFKRLHDKVTESEFKEYEDGHTNERGYSGEYVPIHKDTEVYTRVAGNLTNNEKERRKQGSKHVYPDKFYPKKRILLNIIDRHDEWCKENKHTKAFSSSHVFWKNDDKGNPIHFSDVGVPNYLYDLIMKEILGYRNSWDGIDIISKKESKDYTVKDIRDEKISDFAKTVGIDGPLTEEEKSYELYDFDQSFKVTSYQKLYKNFEGLFRKVDLELGTDFFSELKELVLNEKAEKDAEKESEIEEVNSQEPVQDIVEPSVETEVVSTVSIPDPPVEEPIVQRTRQPQESSLSDECRKYFPSWDTLIPKEKENMMNAIESFKDGVPVWVNPKDPMPCSVSSCVFPNTDIQTSYPSNVAHCPICGVKDVG